MDDFDSNKDEDELWNYESPNQRKESIKMSSMVDLDMKEEILAGIEFRIQYLGSGILSKSGGTDVEIARVIHDIHELYGKAAIKKASEVVVYVDTQRINVHNKSDDENLLSFPLTQVRDVAACLDQPPYSKTCVLVAKENDELLYKAYVFYCTTEKKAARFYKVASLAFQLGFELLKKYSSHFNECSCNDLDALCSGSMEIFAKDTNECEIKQIKCRSCRERDGSQHEIFKEGLHKSAVENIPPANNSGKLGRTVTVMIQLQSEKSPSASRKNEKGHMQTDEGLGEQDKKIINQSRLKVYVENIEERSRFLLPRWLRSSYRKFRRISIQESLAQGAEKVQL